MRPEEFNICLMTDSYKLGHHQQYPEGTKVVYSYFESRDGAQFPRTTFFGLQYLIKKYLEGQVVTQEKIDRAAALAKAHLGSDAIFNREMWQHILDKHDGHLPVKIKAVPEGSVVDVSNVLMTVENTDPKCFALTNHLETLLCHVWYASTVATLSREAKDILKYWVSATSDDDKQGGLDFMLHDFGYRGVSSVESAGIGGCAHLINFLGTDTIRALEVAMEYYGASLDGVGYSVPATEHSVMTARGPGFGEESVVCQILDEYRSGIVSIVGDSYDIYNFCENIIGGIYRELILERDGVVVVRPDSGDPVNVMLKCLEILAGKFGYTKNKKGYNVINPKVRILWGDGIDLKGIDRVCASITNAGWSMENIAAFGMGGGLLQKINRDTQRFAFKCSAQLRDGLWHSIYKDPIEGGKSSKRGRLVLGYDEAERKYYTQTDNSTLGIIDNLHTVFRNGKMFWECTLDDVRKQTMRTL